MGKSSRRGFGVATMLAVMVPALVLVVACAHMFQASSVRRFTSKSYAQYLSGEITESAIAEAAHQMSVRHMFPDATNEAGFTNAFVQKMLADGFGTLPADLTRKNMQLFAREVMPALKKLA